MGCSLWGWHKQTAKQNDKQGGFESSLVGIWETHANCGQKKAKTRLAGINTDVRVLSSIFRGYKQYHFFYEAEISNIQRMPLKLFPQFPHWRRTLAVFQITKVDLDLSQKCTLCFCTNRMLQVFLAFFPPFFFLSRLFLFYHNFFELWTKWQRTQGWHFNYSSSPHC